MSFRARCKGLCYRVPLGIVLSVCILSMLLSMVCGCFIVSNRMDVCLPRFCLPVFLLSLLLMLAHTLLILDMAFMLIDNFKCRYNIRTFIVLASVFILSAVGYNFLLRLCVAVLPVLCFGISMALMILQITENNRRFLIFSIPAAVIMAYFFIVSIFVNS